MSFVSFYVFVLFHFSNFFAYSEYLAAFQKTVAMHEVFLMRLVSHPSFKEDTNLQVFLEFEKDVSKT